MNIHGLIHATNFVPVHRPESNLKAAVIDPERCNFYAHIEADEG